MMTLVELFQNDYEKKIEVISKEDKESALNMLKELENLNRLKELEKNA